MNIKFPFFFLLSLNIFFVNISAQSIVTPVSKIDSVANNNTLTIVYDIQVKTDKSKTGIEETYNGGIKTIFINKEQARVRLVSLMRIQSIFFSASVNSNHPVSIVKESGKKKYKCYLTNNQWISLNNKYNNDSCQLANDSVIILNYPCRKAIITLRNGRILTAYYTNQLNPISPKIEPAFSCIPGLVLQYQYTYKKGTIIYTASNINQNPIDGNIFKIPVKGYIQKKYSLSKTREANIPASPDID
jgi:GLPGLI family protein